MERVLDEYTMRQASIFELRNIAREMGVISPTIYKKEVLIDKITKIMNGEEKPQMPKSRQGRPPKTIKKGNNGYSFPSPEIERVDNLNDRINLNEEVNSGIKYDFSRPSTGGNWIIASPGFVYGEEQKAGENPIKLTKTEGYFLKLSDKDGFILNKQNLTDLNSAIFVAEKYIVGYGFKTGDLVSCSTREVATTNTKYLAMVHSINGFDEIVKSRPVFEDLPLNVLEEPKTVNVFNSAYDDVNKLNFTAFGTRNVILSPSLKVYGKLLSSVKNLPQDVVVVNLCLDALPEDIYVFKDKPQFENFFSLFCDTEKQQEVVITLAINRVKRLVESGKKVLFFVNEIKKLIKHQNFILGNSAEDFKNKSLNTCYNILSLARNIKDTNASVTIYALLKSQNESNFDKIILSELENMNCNFFNM